MRANPTDIVKRMPFESVALTTFRKIRKSFLFRERTVFLERIEEGVNYLGHIVISEFYFHFSANIDKLLG